MTYRSEALAAALGLVDWRRTAAARIRRLAPEAAKACLEAIRLRGVTIEKPEIRELTGGFASQNVNGWVVRKLAERAGLAGIGRRK